MYQREVNLTPAQAANFQSSLAARRALMEAAELIARQYAEKLQANNEALQAAYADAAEDHGLDLQRCQYEFNPQTNKLFLAACRYDPA